MAGMKKFKHWLPAVIMMTAIFIFSSIPGSDMPDYGIWDFSVKKLGHAAGYAILAVSYWYAMGLDPQKSWLAWALAVIYAATDEFHQTFTPGRNASIVDVLLFDNLGALFGILAARWWLKK